MLASGRPPPPEPGEPRRARLADGREILYFADAGASAPEPPPDPRDLEPRPEPADLRRDPLTGEWIAIAAHRQTRTFLPPADACPLCPSRDGRRTEIPADRYDVVVFENRFPSLPARSDEPDAPNGGRCEVVVFSDDHYASFASLTDARLRTIVEAWAHRERELAADPAVAQVFTFENRGVEIGVTLHHPHGQIYAYPYVPPQAERMGAQAAAHHGQTGRCLGCDALAAELDDGRRIVAADELAVAYVPHAARWPNEVHVVPRRHADRLDALTPEERLALVRLQADMLARLDARFGRPVPTMAGWFPAPRGIEAAAHHLRLEIVSPQRAPDKLKFLAGSESLMGAFVGDVLPEETAAVLHDTPGRTA